MERRQASTMAITLGVLGVLAGSSAALAPARAPVLIGLAHPKSVWVVGARDATRGWLDDRRSYALFTPGRRFGIFGAKGQAGTVTIGGARSGDVLGGYVASSRERVKTAPAIAISGASRPLPRRLRAQSLRSPLYQKAAAGALRGKGLTVPSARLTQHLRVDLNGDGQEEVLFCAHSRSGIGSDLRASRNDYALAALRFVSGGKVTLVPLGIEAYGRDRPAGTVAMSRYEFLGCVDIDGDGRLEIVLYSKEFEGDAVQVFTFDGKAPRRVLSAAWGV